MYIYCTMLGVYLISSAPIVRVTSLKTPFGLVIPLLQSSTIRNYNHSQLFPTLCYSAQLTNTYLFVTTITYYTLALQSLITRSRWLTSQLSLLSQIITHFSCLPPIEASPVELLVTNSYRELSVSASCRELTELGY
jgi:hypothetical protein